MRTLPFNEFGSCLLQLHSEKTFCLVLSEIKDSAQKINAPRGSNIFSPYHRYLPYMVLKPV